MKTDIWMPIYLGDYSKDTQHLSCEEHGAYLLILMELWIKGGGSIPEKTLQRVSRFPENWEAIKHTLLEFFQVQEGQISHKRLTAEYKKWAKFRSIKQAAGRMGGRPKKPTGLANDNLQVNLQVKPSPSPIYTDSFKGKKVWDSPDDTPPPDLTIADLPVNQNGYAFTTDPMNPIVDDDFFDMDKTDDPY